MSKLPQGKPKITASPHLTIDPGLLPGRHRFQLVVIDANGNRSLADTVTVKVLKVSPGKPRGE